MSLKLTIGRQGKLVSVVQLVFQPNVKRRCSVYLRPESGHRRGHPSIIIFIAVVAMESPPSTYVSHDFHVPATPNREN